MSSPSSIPANLPKIVDDFLKDLNLTFPEYSAMWTSQPSMGQLFQHFKTIFPPLFFDILYQNEDIFADGNPANTHFLPNVDFRTLMNDPTVSANTRQSIWKYLQLIMFSIMGSLGSAEQFGEMGGLFSGLSEGDLQSKLAESIEGIRSFFENQRARPSAGAGASAGDEAEDQMPPIPDPTNLMEIIKGLLKGKLGQLAQELTEELKGDLGALFSEAEMREMGDLNPTQLIQQLMKNPQKMMDLVNKIYDKFQAKMDSGEINKEDMMKEAKDVIDGMGGIHSPQFQEMFQGMAQKMGLGKDVRIDENRYKQMEEKVKTRERMRAKAEKRRAERAEMCEQLESNLTQRDQRDRREGDKKSYKEEQAEIEALLMTLEPLAPIKPQDGLQHKRVDKEKKGNSGKPNSNKK
jgi:hypothetical protein